MDDTSKQKVKVKREGVPIWTRSDKKEKEVKFVCWSWCHVEVASGS